MAFYYDLGDGTGRYNLWGTLTFMAASGLCLKDLSISYARDGTIVATVAVLGRANTVIDMLKSYTLCTIQRVTERGGVTTLVLVDESNLVTRIKVPISAVFKSVAKDVIYLHESKIIPTEVVSPIDFAEATVFLRVTNSPYEDDDHAWTVRSILRALGFDNIIFPAAWNYRVSKFSVTAGTPLVTVLNSLFPFPGVVIKRMRTGFYVGWPSAIGEYPGPPNCVVAETEKLVKIHLHIKGDVGRVKFIRGGSRVGTYTETTPQGTEITYVTNLVGGVFVVTKTVIQTELAQVPTEVWEPLVTL